MSSMQRRRQMVKNCKKHGLHVQPAALAAMLKFQLRMEEEEDTPISSSASDLLYPFLQALQEKLARAKPKIITLHIWEQTIQEIHFASTNNEMSKQAFIQDDANANNENNVNVSFPRERSLSKKSDHPKLVKSKKASKTCRSWYVVDAFDTPKLVYDSLRQQFHYKVYPQAKSKSTVGDRPSLLGTIDDRIEMMSQRFLQVQQRVARIIPCLSSIDRLLGTNGGGRRHDFCGPSGGKQILLGLLHATSVPPPTTSLVAGMANGAFTSTNFELEDLTGTIPLEIHAKSIFDGRGIYTEGCLVIVDGHYNNGIFVVEELKLPPIESKKKAYPYLPPTITTGAMQVQAQSMVGSGRQLTPSPLTIYSMANIALDDPSIVHDLEDLVDDLSRRGFEDDANFGGGRDEVLLVLMGNFTTSSLSLTTALDELFRILEPLSSRHSVLIMPGPKDTASLCWPIPPILQNHNNGGRGTVGSNMAQQLDAHVQFVSNPCRLYYGDGTDRQEVLLYRQDLIQQHLRNEILSVRTAEDLESHEEKQPSITARVLHTILAQGHILPQAPIYWNFDHALSVYPLPEVLLIGLEEGNSAAKSFIQADCQVLTTGSEGSWSKIVLQPSSTRTAQPRGRRGVKRSYHIEFSNQQSHNESDGQGSGIRGDDDLPTDFMADN